jgi:hypothetical protein
MEAGAEDVTDLMRWEDLLAEARKTTAELGGVAAVIPEDPLLRATLAEHLAQHEYVEQVVAELRERHGLS